MTELTYKHTKTIKRGAHLTFNAIRVLKKNALTFCLHKVFIKLIASAKSRSVRGASHQLAFMSSCLTISHMCLPCLPSGRVSPSVPGVV